MRFCVESFWGFNTTFLSRVLEYSIRRKSSEPTLTQIFVYPIHIFERVELSKVIADFMLVRMRFWDKRKISVRILGIERPNCVRTIIGHGDVVIFYQYL